MTEPHLSDMLRHAVDDVTSSLDPHQTWAGGRRRHRRATELVVASSVAAAAVILGGVQALTSNEGGGRSHDPAPSPTTSLPAPTDSNAISPIRIDPSFDPANWEDLPEYPQDLGWWASPDRPQRLEPGSIETAHTAVSFALSEDEANLFVFDDQGRWLVVDTGGIEFADTSDVQLGLGRRSLSPDGTLLALGQTDGISVIDLRTTRVRTYAVAGLDPAWTGREVSWTADGSAVFLARTMPAGNDANGYRYPTGVRIDLASGAVTPLDHDPLHAVALSDGTIITNQRREDRGDHVVAHDSNGSRTQLEEVRRTIGAASDFSASPGTLWATRREARMMPDLVEGVSGFMAFDGYAPLAALPVKGVENNGGGGQLIGWLDASRLVFSMPVDVIGGPEVDRGTVVWDVHEGTLWRGPLTLENTRVSIAPR